MKVVLTILVLMAIVVIYLIFVIMMAMYLGNKEWPEFALMVIVFVSYCWLLARIETRREAR